MSRSTPWVRLESPPTGLELVEATPGPCGAVRGGPGLAGRGRDLPDGRHGRRPEGVAGGLRLQPEQDHGQTGAEGMPHALLLRTGGSAPLPYTCAATRIPEKVLVGAARRPGRGRHGRAGCRRQELTLTYEDPGGTGGFMRRVGLRSKQYPPQGAGAVRLRPIPPKGW